MKEKKMKKRIVAIIVAITLLGGAVGCAYVATDKTRQSKSDVVSVDNVSSQETTTAQRTTTTRRTTTTTRTTVTSEEDKVTTSASRSDSKNPSGQQKTTTRTNKNQQKTTTKNNVPKTTTKKVVTTTTKPVATTKKTTPKPTTKPTTPAPTTTVSNKVTWSRCSQYEAGILADINNRRVAEGLPALIECSSCKQHAVAQAEWNASHLVYGQLSWHNTNQCGAESNTPTAASSLWWQSAAHRASLTSELNTHASIAVYKVNYPEGTRYCTIINFHQDGFFCGGRIDTGVPDSYLRK